MTRRVRLRRGELSLEASALRLRLLLLALQPGNLVAQALRFLVDDIALLLGADAALAGVVASLAQVFAFGSRNLRLGVSLRQLGAELLDPGFEGVAHRLGGRELRAQAGDLLLELVPRRGELALGVSDLLLGQSKRGSQSLNLQVGLSDGGFRALHVSLGAGEVSGEVARLVLEPGGACLGLCEFRLGIGRGGSRRRDVLARHPQLLVGRILLSLGSRQVRVQPVRLVADACLFLLVLRGLVPRGFELRDGGGELAAESSVFLGGGCFVGQELGDLFVGIRGGSDGSRRLFL